MLRIISHLLVEEDMEWISNLKLQKLLYYAQAYSLVILKRPIFPEAIEHWTHGLVVPEIYHKYKDYGFSLLPVVSELDLQKYQDDELYILQRVRTEKGCYTAWALRNETHYEAPWINTHSGEEITTDAIAEYFSQVLEKTDFNFDLQEIRQSIESGFEIIPEFENEQDLMNWMMK